MNGFILVCAAGLVSVAAAVQPDRTRPAQPTPTKQPPDRPLEKDLNRDKKDFNKDNRAHHAEPGPEHRNLNVFVGTWDATGQTWGEDGASPETLTGTCTTKWILDGRFVQSHAEGSAGGKPYEGFGVVGYDNAQKKYVSGWQDNMGTSMMLGTGDYDASTKTFTYKGESKDEKGMSVQHRCTIKVTSDAEHTQTTYATAGGRKEAKIMEITFRRNSADTTRPGQQKDERKEERKDEKK